MSQPKFTPELDDLKSKVTAIIEPIAAKFETKPEHWIHGWDEGFSFCYDCAVKKIAELLTTDPKGDYLVDGGFGSEGDSMAFCHACGCPLDNSFTDYACEQELDHFEEAGFTLTPSDCYSFDNILGSQGWEGGELSERIHALARKIVAKSESIAQEGEGA